MAIVTIMVMTVIMLKILLGIVAPCCRDWLLGIDLMIMMMIMLEVMIARRCDDHLTIKMLTMIIKMLVILLVGCTFLRLKLKARRSNWRHALKMERSVRRAAFRDELASMRGVFRFQRFEFEV